MGLPLHFREMLTRIKKFCKTVAQRQKWPKAQRQDARGKEGSASFFLWSSMPEARKEKRRPYP
jgi:hypothetical protein